jgi:cytoskeletal protein CcmA (bactofilin family)
MQENTSDTGRMPSLAQPAAGERKVAVLGPTLRFKGDLYAERAVVVDGNVEGDLYGKESVVVHETGRVHGNIYAPRVGISDGAVFNGRIDMSNGAAATQPAPQVAAAPTPVAQPKRVETPVMSPGQPMSAEETEKILTPKVTVLPPPPRKVG